MGIVDSAIVRLLPAVPKPVVRRISSRYIAGEELDDALRVVLQLNAEGKLATIDVLGEEITEPGEAQAIAAAYREAFEAIERGKLDSNVSIKPTAAITCTAREDTNAQASATEYASAKHERSTLMSL